MSGDMDFQEIKKDVKKTVSDITEIPEEELKDDAVFTDDLGIDSMMALEVVASVEKKYKVRISEEEIPTLRSLQNIYDLLERLLKG